MAGLSLQRCVNALGITAVAAYAVMAATSYLQAPALWDPVDAPNATAFFNRLYGVEHVNAIRALFDGPLAVVVSHWIPLIVASLAMVVLVFLLGQNPRQQDHVTAPLILKWSLAFAAVSFFAFPVFTQDFWLSVIWGDMIASGINPYYETFTPAMLERLPLDHFPMTMSYGPLWAVISAATMAVAGGSLLATALLFKAVLTASWCASLVLVDKIMRRTGSGHRSTALAVAGWVPLGVWQTVGEGHNDIIMALPALLWVVLLLQTRMSAPLALAASALCKYTTAPLFLVDLIYCIRKQGLGPRAYVLRLIPAILFSVAVMALFYRSFAFFDGVLLISEWRFLQPSDAFAALAEALGDWLEPFGKLISLIFPAIAVHQCVTYWKKPDDEQMLRAAVAVMSAVSFSAISHLWPWYLVWTLPMAALVPGWWLSRFVIGLAIAAPFTVVVWWVPEVEESKHSAALIMYAGAALWTLLTAPRAEESPQEIPNVVRNVDFARARSETPVVALARKHEPEYHPEIAAQVKTASADG